VYAPREDAAGMAEAETFRRQLQLPTDRLIVMSGHQAGWWHAGILAKYFAMIAASQALEAAPVWLVVDQDASDGLSIRYPLPQTKGGEGSAGGFAARTWLLGPEAMAADLRADIALGSLEPFEPSPLPAGIDALNPNHARALRAMHECTKRAMEAAEPDFDLHASPDMLMQSPRPHSAALQLALANQELLSSLAPSAQLIAATALTQTSAFRGVLERMIEEPQACVEAYNAALLEHPVHGVAPLAANAAKGRYELPLWSIGPGVQASGKGQPRKRIYTTTLGDTPVTHLAPRALLMTAMFRWLGCDLFVHGLGGGATMTLDESADATDQTSTISGYDRVAEAWFRRWLGVSLAPSVVTSATLLLDLGHQPTVSLQDLSAARQAAHRIKHHPKLVGDHAAQARKQALIEQIRTSTDPQQRAMLYRQMHEELASFRAANDAQIAAQVHQSAALAKQYAQESILRDRTWPWPLHDRKSLLNLQRKIHAALQAPISERGTS
jgi:hypothetical protein